MSRLTVSLGLLAGLGLWALANDSSGEGLAPTATLKILNNREVSAIHLKPHFATTLILPGKVSSLTVGDPTLFQAEHSPEEPNLVFVKPLVSDPAESNLIISTVSGETTSLLLRSGVGGPVHFVVRFETLRRSFLIDEQPSPDLLVPDTVSLSNAAPMADVLPAPKDDSEQILKRLLQRQQTVTPDRWVGKRVKVAIGDIYQRGQRMYLLFAMKNPSGQNLEVLPPQLQLTAKLKKKRVARAAQIPVDRFLLSRRHLLPGRRGDGVVVFEKPQFKQSNETYYLQIADSSAVDLPTLAPVNLRQSKPLKGVR